MTSHRALVCRKSHQQSTRTLTRAPPPQIRIIGAVLTLFAFLFAALCAAVMGFAVQRGATCTVAAVDELVSKRSGRRVASLIEAALWVAGGLLVAQTLHMLPTMPSGYPLSRWTVAGGVLLGLGAYVNQACVFGAIARFGSGEWVYLATPAGFYLGCLIVRHAFALPEQAQLPYGSPVLQAPAWVAAVFLAFVAWRLARPILGLRANATNLPLLHRVRDALGSRIWSPHAATTVIGIAFFFMLMLVGAWAYTDVLAELAQGMAASLTARCLLALALLVGAAWGGWSAGRFRSVRITAAQVLKCLVGGSLMGAGSLLIPGGNDALLLVGMPLLWPYAWVAILAMCLSIAAAQMLRPAAPGI
jgi:Sulphur transport